MTRKIRIRSDWRVMPKQIDGRTVFQIYRLQDRNEPDRSQNRITLARYFDDREGAEAEAQERNERDRRRRTMERICGTCNWHVLDRSNTKDLDYYCDCEDSEAYGCSTNYDDECGEWEEKTRA